MNVAIKLHLLIFCGHLDDALFEILTYKDPAIGWYKAVLFGMAERQVVFDGCLGSRRRITGGRKELWMSKRLHHPPRGFYGATGWSCKLFAKKVPGKPRFGSGSFSLWGISAQPFSQNRKFMRTSEPKRGTCWVKDLQKTWKRKKMARRVPISNKFSAPKPLFTAKHRGNDLYSGALRCAVCFMSSAAALPYKTGERRRAGFWRGGLRELDTNRSGGLKGLNSPFKKTAVRLLGSSHCQNREVVLPTSVFIFMCVTECGSNMDAKKKYKN